MCNEKSSANSKAPAADWDTVFTFDKPSHDPYGKLMEMVSPSRKPSVRGVELSVVNSTDNGFGRFQTWVTTNFGLFALVGKLHTANTESQRMMMPLLLAAIGVGAKAVRDPDPVELLDTLTDYLCDHERLAVSISISAAAWDRDSSLINLSAAGDGQYLFVEGSNLATSDGEGDGVGSGSNKVNSGDCMSFKPGSYLLLTAEQLPNELVIPGSRGFTAAQIAEELTSRRCFPSLVLTRAIDLP